jgi:hypothetical protein
MKLRFLLWSAFIVLWIVSLSSIQLDTLLAEKEYFVIGQATKDGFSIGKRISNYYYALFFGAGLIGICYFLFKKYLTKFESTKYILWVDSLIGIGITFCISQFFGFQLINTVNLLGVSAIVLLIASRKWENKISPWKITASFFVFLSLYQVFHSGITASVIGITSFFTLLFFENKRISFYFISLVCFAPLFLFFIFESSIVLNQNHIFGFSYWLMTLVFVGILVFILIRKHKKFVESQENYLFKTLVPVSLVGCIILQQYSFTQIQSTDLFETANFWNPVMQYYRFGEIPFLHNMSSHLISDYFFQFVYTSLNGFDTSTDLQLYDFLKWALYIYSIYLFAIHYFENKYAAIFFVLLSPFLWFIVSPLYSLVFVSIYFIIKYLESFEKKFLIYFFGSIVFITLWNLTIGVSLVFAAFLFSVSLFIYFKETRIQLLKIIAVFGISSIACLGIYHFSFPTHLRQFLLYFSANQAHGYSQLTNSFSIEFALNYYIYPILISLVFVYNFFQLKTKSNITKNFVLIFLSGIYFFSLQRGLVRHSFIENNESLIATTARLIILLEVYHLIKSYKYAFVALFSGVFVFSTFTTIQTNFEGSSNFVEAKVTFSLNDLPHLGKEKLQRTLPNQEYEWRTKTIVNFLKSNLSQKETFLDFTYNPALYYYTQKNVPSFFSQHIQNTVSEKAQEMNIKELENSSIKYVLFACQNGFGVNDSDGIPNRVRYFRTTNYIFKNFVPYKEIGGYFVYTRKEFSHSKDSILIPEENWDLGYLPYYWKPSLENETFKEKASLQISNGSIDLKQEKINSLSFLKLTISTPKKMHVKLVQGKLKIRFKTKIGKHTYYIPIGCSENNRFTKEKVVLGKILSKHLLSASLVELKK